MFPNEFGKAIMYIGIGLVVFGAIVHFGGKFLPLGKLPGDFKWESGNFGVYVPIVSSILISLVLTVLLNLFFRR